MLAATVALLALVGTSAAFAATEFGSACTASHTFNGGEISTAHGPTSNMPAAAPISGVLTEWRLNVGTFATYEPEEAAEQQKALYQQLYVVKPSDPRHYTVVGKSESALAVFGSTSSFLTRIPIQQGDLLGLGGPVTLYCTTEDTADMTVDFRGAPAVGATIETGLEPFTGFQVPVVAKIEPDADGDGYGDETQDKCPQSAAYHEACPVVKIGALPTVGAKAVALNVSTSLSAPVAVTASVGIGKGTRVALTAPTQTVSPGSLAGFTLTLTPQVTNVLKTLSVQKALTMTITASATNVTGAPSTSLTTVKLKGLAKKPAHKKQSPGKPKKK